MLKNPLIAVHYGLSAKFVCQFPSFANRGLSHRLVRSASGDDGRNYLGVRTQSIFQVAVLKSPATAPFNFFFYMLDFLFYIFMVFLSV
jgi:hypothetical protein